MKTCPECYREHPDPVLTCDCGYDFKNGSSHPNDRSSSPTDGSVKGGNAYPILSAISKFYIFLAVISALATVGLAIYRYTETQLVEAATVVGVGIFATVAFLGLAELLDLLIDMSTNLKRIASK